MDFPLKFKHWINHEINRCANPLFAGIPEERRPEIWQKIEDQYLKKYNNIVRFEFDWGASAFWEPPFPGTIATGPNWSLETFYLLPDEVKSRIESWVEKRDNNSLFNDNYDYDASEKEGMQIALEIRKYLPVNVYLEFHYFKEIKILGGIPVELDIPAFLKEFFINSDNHPYKSKF